MTDDRLLSIGELSRTSGLTVSALRFYDRAGVLAPACVDAWSGYRRYAPAQVREARLLAGMRRVQVPVAEMASVLDGLRGGDLDAVHDLLDGHLRRLEEGLADARRELGRLRAALGPSRAASAEVPAASLLGLLGAVRPAVGTDPELPVLMGVLLEVSEGLTLVATDRYRLVVAGPWQPAGDGTTVSAVVPTAEVDRLAAWLAGRQGRVVVTVLADGVVVRAGDGTGDVRDPDCGEQLRLDVVDGDYPDFRRVLEHGHEGCEPVDADVLRSALDTGEDLVELEGVTVDRSYLWDAVRSVPDGQVLLPAHGVIAPLVVRSPDEDLLALVMPVAGRDR